MKMEVQIISKETIKPSSPTPQNLRNYKLSLLDHLIPSPYAPIVLFYHSSYNHSVISLDLLKQSLSKTLTRFYPLAGTIKDDLSIECNDQGAYFVETKVGCSLDQFLTKPDLLLIQKFLPCDLILKESAVGTFVSNFQVNVFECGGIAIGICISHKVLDGAALSTFIKSWSGAARGCVGEPILPKYVATSLFPTSDLWLRDSSILMWGSLFRLGRCRTQRFVFDSSAIATLKAKGYPKLCPTRVEAVSGFLWKCLMNASENRHGSPRPSLLTHLVNLRRRISHPNLENSMGNLLWIASTQCTIDQSLGLDHFVGKVKEAISKIDSEFVKKLSSEEGNSVMSDSFKGIGELGRQGADIFGFSSWCKFGFYDADFGWGKPVWVSSFGMDGSAFINLIMLNDTRSGDGIEAWVTSDEEEMNILENNPELVELASLDPSPLYIGGM